jgi:hypothetical protein
MRARFVMTLAATAAAASLGCVTGDPVTDFREARAAGTPEAYRAFIERHSRNPLARVALKEMTTLREQLDWQAAEQADSEAGYQRFIAAHPESYHALIARQRRDRLVEQADWRTAEDSDRAESYTAFIRKHPASEFNLEAGKRLEAVARWDHVTRVLERCAEQKRQSGVAERPVFAFVPNSGPPFAIIKDDQQRYWKLNGNPDAAAAEFLGGIDAPALSGAPPASGIVIYVSWETLVSERFDDDLQALFSHVRSAFYRGAPDFRFVAFAAPDAPPRRISERGVATTWFGGSQHFRTKLGGGDGPSRARSAQALGLLGDEGAARLLSNAWEDPDEEVRNAAAVALLRLRTQYAQGLLREMALQRIEPLEAAREHWDAAVSARAARLLEALPVTSRSRAPRTR